MTSWVNHSPGLTREVGLAGGSNVVPCRWRSGPVARPVFGIVCPGDANEVGANLAPGQRPAEIDRGVGPLDLPGFEPKVEVGEISTTGPQKIDQARTRSRRRLRL